MHNRHIQLIKRISMIVLLLSCILLLHYVAIIYMYPFIIALFISSILHPIVSYVERTMHLNRHIASYVVILFSLGIMFLGTFFLLQRLSTELSHLIVNLPAFFQDINAILIKFGQTTLVPLYESIQTKFVFLPGINEWNLEETISFITNKLYDSSYTGITNLFLSITTIFTSISHTIMILFFIIIGVFMMTKDYTLLKRLGRQLVPVKVRKKGFDFIFQFKQSLIGLVKAHFFLAFLSSCIAFIGFFIFRIEHIIVMTSIIFIVDLIPYIGVGFIFIPWILYLFLTGQYLMTIQLICIYMLIVIIRQFIEPKVIARHLGIHPLIALIILYVSIKHLGLLGILMTPMILVILSSIYHIRIFSYLQNFISDKK